MDILEGFRKIQEDRLKAIQARPRGLTPPESTVDEIRILLECLKTKLPYRGAYQHNGALFKIYFRSETVQENTLSITNLEVTEEYRGRGIYTAVEQALIKAALREKLRLGGLTNPALIRRFELLSEDKTSGWIREGITAFSKSTPELTGG